MKEQTTFSVFFTSLFGVLFMASYGAAQDKGGKIITDPELDYINTPESVRVDYGILHKDKIRRMELDLDDSGQASVFLVNDGAGSKTGAVWTAYIPIENNGYTRVDGVQFRTDFLRSGKVDDYNPDGGLLTIYPGGKGKASLIAFHLKEKQALGMRELRSLDFSNASDVELIEEIFGRNPGEPVGRDYFENPPYDLLSVDEINLGVGPSPNAINEISSETGAPSQIVAGAKSQEITTGQSDSKPKDNKDRFSPIATIALVFALVVLLIIGVRKMGSGKGSTGD